MLEFPLLAAVQIAWIVASGVWSVRRKDELPLVVSGFLFYVFGFRLWVLQSGLSSPVDISPFGFEPMGYEAAISTLGLAILGESALLGAYFWAQKVSLAGVRPVLTAVQGRFLRRLVIALVVVCMPLVFLTRGFITAQSEAGKTLAFEVSNYAFLFPLMLSGLAILVAALWKAGQLPGTFWKLAATGLLLVITKLTFAPSLRFQFLGWLLAATFIFTAGLSLLRRVGVLAVGGALAVTFFAVAGALRNQETVEGGLQQESFERFAFAEDANMLDGFATLRQVFPQRLDYTWGREHLDVLLRPIPRALWPGKPVGGYMNKLGLTTAESGFTLGISPSLLGSLFQEGGVEGMVLLAALYGFCLGRLVVFTATRMQPFAGVLSRGVLCAFLIPLLRGGDLPGIYAWFGMSFWPCLLVLWWRRREWFTPPLRAATAAVSVGRPGRFGGILSAGRSSSSVAR